MLVSPAFRFPDLFMIGGGRIQEATIPDFSRMWDSYQVNLLLYSPFFFFTELLRGITSGVYLHINSGLYSIMFSATSSYWRFWHCTDDVNGDVNLCVVCFV